MGVEMVKEEWAKQIGEGSVIFTSESLLQFHYKCCIDIACI